MIGHVLGKTCSFGRLMFPLLCLFVALVVSNFGFEGRTLVLIASVSGDRLPRKKLCTFRGEM